MPAVTFCFEVHQPIRISHFQSNGFLKNSNPYETYFNHGLNKWIFERIANKCYLPTNRILLEILDNLKHEKKKFKVAFSLTGTFVESAEKYNKDVLSTFKQLAEKPEVEFLGETYYHSLAGLYENEEEFIEQIEAHKQMLKDYFNVQPKVFVNTEMLYNNRIAKIVEKLGFKAIFTEGAERILEWRNPNYVYVRKYCFPDDPSPQKRLRVLLRNYRLSDDIGYRFSARDWDQWPLTAEKYTAWLSATPGQVVNIFMDYETFGEHQPQESGIFWFLKALPYMIIRDPNLEVLKPSEVIERYQPVGEIDIFEFSTVSWADMERDTSAWLGNRMQQIAFNEIKNIEKIVKEVGNPDLIRIWRLLQQSDHYYYVCNKWWSDGDVHKYFSIFGTPEEAFANLINIISDFKARLLIEREKLNGGLKQ
ncbi:MAG: glycoside hydrolase family 57 protein [Candidatus Aenigmarchaeota archaeon]|nr:glycoside hydrolase family 57 protein [Candidatus Aenigmarchaeota archaeon]